MQTTCPENESLARYVSGTLPVADARLLADHLERCENCQSAVDLMASGSDALIEAARRPVEKPKEDPALLKLIRQAQELDPSIGREEEAESKDDDVPPMGMAEFVRLLHKSGLMDRDEIDRLAKRSKASDGTTFARQLVKRNKLTSYQARALTRGRWRGLVLGKYIVLEKLGQGGMGHVFKARHRKMGRVVCLKVLHTSLKDSPELVKRFQREASTVAALSHPNIVVAHDADEAEGIPFLVMEYVDGKDLAKVVAREGPLTVDKTVAVIHQVATALDYAHRRGVVHRDVKPHNLVLDQRGSVKVLDLGLARFDTYLSRHPDATTHVSMTISGQVMGTVDYMSPEQALNSRLADERSDIYSLGCTLWYLLSGRPLFDGHTLMEKLVAHRERPAPSLAAVSPTVSAGLDAIFRKMVAKRPSDRYGSMIELLSDLRTLEAGGYPQAMDDLAPPPSPVLTRTLGASAAVLSVVAVLLGLMLWGPLEHVSLANLWPNLGNDVTDDGADDVQRAGVSPNEAEPKPPAPPPIVGHRNTLVNGGPGRALLVVPHGWFYEDHYQQMSWALANRGIEVVAASSQLGQARPKHNKIPPVDVNFELDKFDPDDFDAVVFIGGNHNEFTHKGSAGEATKRMIQQCFEKGLAVATIGGDDVLRDTGILKACAFTNYKSVSVGKREDMAGAALGVRESKRSGELVDVMFDNVLADRAKRDDG